MIWKTLLQWLTGDVVGRILTTVDKSIDNETKRQELRAKAIEAALEAHTQEKLAAMQSKMFWRVWALFAVPLGLWWALVMADTMLPFVSLSVPDLPLSVKPWADLIFGSLFGSGAAVGGAQAIASAIRGRK